MEEFVAGGIVFDKLPRWRYRCQDCGNTFKTEEGARRHWARNGGRNRHLMWVASLRVKKVLEPEIVREWVRSNYI